MGNFKNLKELKTYYKQQGISEKEIDAVDWGNFDVADGVNAGDEIMVLRPNQIKSADAVTYDDNGVRIPLGKRDNFNISDIRYFTPSTAKEALANDLKLSGKHLTLHELENIIKLAGTSVYKSYLPGSNYYNRLIANGVSKDELSRLSNEVANNISGTDYVTFNPTENWVAATLFKGPHRNSIEVNPSSFGSAKIANEVVEHELEHAATNGVMPLMWRLANSGYVVVGDANPTILKAFDYNYTIKPTLKQEVIEQMKSGDNRLIQHVKDVTNPQDLRARAMVAERDAQRHGMDILSYYNHPLMHNLNMKLLTELYTPNTLKKYIRYFKVIAPIMVGATNKPKD